MRLALTLAIAALAATASTEASAQGFSLRAGASLRPLIGSDPYNGFHTIGDGGFIGIDIAPGLKILEILTLEVDLVPLIPITVTSDTYEYPDGFRFMFVPGARIDLFVAYARAGIPIMIGNTVQPAIEGAFGLSLLSFGYIGLLGNYAFDDRVFGLGIELGIRI